MKLGNILSNRNLIIIMSALFLSWLLFFDQNSYVDLKDLDEKIEKLTEERDFYLQKIAQDSDVIRNIEDSAFLEKYARENFFFIGEGETMYLIDMDTTVKTDTYHSQIK